LAALAQLCYGLLALCAKVTASLRCAPIDYISLLILFRSETSSAASGDQLLAPPEVGSNRSAFSPTIIL
jgi:hypothetical protein